jgi:hypothetical protein
MLVSQANRLRELVFPAITRVKDRRAQGVLKMEVNMHHNKHVMALLCQ